MGGGRRSWEGPETPFSHWYWDPRLDEVERARLSLLKGLWLEATLCLTVLLGTTGYSLLEGRRQKVRSIGALLLSLLAEPRANESTRNVNSENQGAFDDQDGPVTLLASHTANTYVQTLTAHISCI